MTEAIGLDRRHFLGMAAMTMAGAPFGAIGTAEARPANTQTAALAPIQTVASSSFGALKQIDAGVLNVGYADVGPASGPPVILLHGWPYDIHSYVDVAPLLASAGYRVIVLTCAATARRASGRATHSETLSRRQWPPISLP